MMKLPKGNLEWMTENEINNFNIDTIDLEGPKGYILEVDLDYPKKLHLKHNELPLAPDLVQVSYNDLSPYSKKALLECDGRKNYKDIKLISSFYPRKYYVTHLKNLKLYLDLGLKLKKIHRILKFDQEAFIKPFIEMCTLARQNSKTKFESDQFKKLANSVYGKTLQSVRNYSVVKLSTTRSLLLKRISDPTFKNFVIISDNLVQTNHETSEILHDRPIFIGFTILELVSKIFYIPSTHIFQFHHKS